MNVESSISYLICYYVGEVISMTGLTFGLFFERLETKGLNN